jgi:CDP-glucose 4,6-dehydratase
MFHNIYNNKTVLITGHTGFKGCWLSIWLDMLGAKVIGISDKPKISHPSHFVISDISKNIKNYYFDIYNINKFKKILNKEKPDFIFHLAAQSLVIESYKSPITTLKTNLWGTLNILESLRDYKKKITIIFITSDKCYKNLEIKRGYNENDSLGGDDIYSSSKACAEILINSYYQSFLKKNKKINLASVRAGNVIGGGDWSKNRLLPDILSNYFDNKKFVIRNPNSTRPWQHVLEPLSGYLYLASLLHSNESLLNGQSFNFGPNSSKSINVLSIVKIISSLVDKLNYKVIPNTNLHENSLLRLNSAKSYKLLNWRPVMNIRETILLTFNWYKNFYLFDNSSILNYSQNQILHYCNLAKKKKMKWLND